MSVFLFLYKIDTITNSEVSGKKNNPPCVEAKTSEHMCETGMGPADRPSFHYSLLFIQLLFHHVSPPGWHRCQTSGLLLGLHVDTVGKGNMGGDGSPESSVKDLN